MEWVFIGGLVWCVISLYSRVRWLEQKVYDLEFPGR